MFRSYKKSAYFEMRSGELQLSIRVGRWSEANIEKVLCLDFSNAWINSVYVTG